MKLEKAGRCADKSELECVTVWGRFPPRRNVVTLIMASDWFVLSRNW